MSQLIARIASLLIILTCAHCLAVDVPKSLEEWKPWVLEKHPDLNCPFLYNDATRACTWPSELRIDANTTGARFTQRIEVYKNDWVALPGNAGFWPQNLSTGNNSIAVRDNNHVPEVYLTLGTHEISGEIRWSEMPHTLQIPTQTGIVQLNLNGKMVVSPAIEDNNQLWLAASEKQTAATHQDTFNLRVFRKLEDSIPLTLTTQLQLEVSGKERELQLGQLLLTGFTVTDFTSALPARIEKDGSLRIQVKPGTWELTLTSISAVPLNDLMFKNTTQPSQKDNLWPEEEIWVFAAQPQLRSVQISGVQTIDPQQTELPDDWKSLPAYLMTPQTHFKIEELQRGENKDFGKNLQLNRNAWLSFTGTHFVVKDRISGYTTASRLETITPFELTSAQIDGEPQLVTHLANSKNSGVEIRERNINLEGTSQLPRSLSIPVTGWNEEFNSVSTRLFLPPGWSLFTATGASSEYGSWISQWTLWDMFIVLIIAVAIAKLTKISYGVLTAATLVLIFHRDGAPVLIWLNLIIAIALTAFVSGKFKSFIVKYTYVGFFLLALILLPFTVHQARSALNPQLDSEDILSFIPSIISSSDKKKVMYKPAPAAVPVAMEEREVDSISAEDIGKFPDQNVEEIVVSGMKSSALQRVAGKVISKKYDPSQQTQTGLAVPTWNRNSVSISWAGPITADETTKLLLVPPLVNRLGYLLCVILPLLLSGVLLLHFFSLLDKKITLPSFTKTSAASLLPSLIIAGLLFVPTDNVKADVTIDPAILTELEARLTQAPRCLPNCAAIESVKLNAQQDQLNIELVVHSSDLISLPLPADKSQWWPTRVSVDGKDATLVQSANQTLLVSLPKGRHTVVLTANLQGRDALNLEFPVSLHNVSANTNGWEVSGAPTAEQQSQSLQLQRVERDQAADKSDHLRPEPVSPFVVVRRELTIDMDWSVTTTVSRVAPAFGAINVEIPLLNGEAPLTTQANAAGKIAVHFEANQDEFEWTSSLKQITPLQLQAAKNGPWVEIWSLNVSPLWHTETKGIAPIQMDKHETLPIWQPWPGETLSFDISRPQATKGNFITIDNAQLDYEPSNRNSQSKLELLIRSNQGGQYGFTLPAEATLASVTIDGNPQIIAVTDGKLKLPLHPGAQTVAIAWKKAESIGVFTQSPAFILEQGSSNQNIRINLAENRWPLFVGGPMIGPSILIWGMLMVVMIIAVALGRSSLTPLKTHEWVLLSLGICTLSFFTFVLVAVWILVLQQRGKLQTITTARKFKFLQFGLFALSIAALSALISTIPQGLLGSPDMHIAGNESYSGWFNWYQDHSDAEYPTAWIISLPLWCYKVAILMWSLWLAASLIKWIRWGWQQLSVHGLWYAAEAIVTNPKALKSETKTDVKAEIVAAPESK
jgi:hypothetical protein